MDKEQLLEVLNIGENCEIEFKEAKKQLPKSLWETYSAFCNSKGGVIILGVVEKGVNYFVFANPGDMRVPFERAKQGGESDPRNRLIHKIFSLVGLGERAGSGIFKITNAWKSKDWIEPEIKELYNPDRTILKLEMKRIKNENVVENVVEKLSTQEQKVLEIIIQKPEITQLRMAKQLGITTRQISRILKDLKEKQVIERIGSDRKGYWKIKT